MSSAEQNSPKEKQSQLEETADQASLKSPPKRPTLVSPPKRPSGPPQGPADGIQKPPSAQPSPVNPVATGSVAESAAEPSQAEATHEPSSADFGRCQPIAPPSEPMQYRAIGLVRGTYQPTEGDQLNRGALITEEGSVIDAVLLGRVTSLVKKHIDLARSHLWVVYPRTRRNEEGREQDLHLQIVGVWEPETLGLPGEAAPKTEEDSAPEAETAEKKSDTADGSLTRLNGADLPPVNDNFFSIRGEVVKYSPEEELISVKILQGIKRSPGSSKPFKVNIKGTIEGRTVGYFWDFKAKREDQLLILEDAAVVGIVPPKKRSKKKPGGWSKPIRGGNGRPPMPSRRPMGAKGASIRPRKVDAGKDLGA